MTLQQLRYLIAIACLLYTSGVLANEPHLAYRGRRLPRGHVIGTAPVHAEHLEAKGDGAGRHDDGLDVLVVHEIGALGGEVPHEDGIDLPIPDEGGRTDLDNNASHRLALPVDDVVVLFVTPASGLELEGNVHDAHLVAGDGAGRGQGTLDARAFHAALQDGDGFVVIPLGLDDHALDALATHAPGTVSYKHLDVYKSQVLYAS